MSRNQVYTLISSDPEIMHGKPCVKGTRIPVALVVSMLADGMSEEEILKDYPSLKRRSIKAALKYASMMCEYETARI
ncbi:MAG: DUF433 domain-containing protein [Ignavibacteria bacterium]|nr:DUF433 domain-containing protein [Ignavibacteria bacterium]MBM4167341.1 DUF433 domain-containing protein [Ignavibacteria bacterium]